MIVASGGTPAKELIMERELWPLADGERERACVVNCVSRSMSVLNIGLRVIHSNMNAGRKAEGVIGRQQAGDS